MGFFKNIFKHGSSKNKSGEKSSEKSSKSLFKSFKSFKSLKDDNMSLYSGGTVNTDCDTKCTSNNNNNNPTEKADSDSGHEVITAKIIEEGGDSNSNSNKKKKDQQRFRFSRPMKKTNFFEPHHCIVPADTLYYKMDELQDKMKEDVELIDKQGQDKVEGDEFCGRGLEYHLECNSSGRGKNMLYQKMVLQKAWSLTRSAKALRSANLIDKIPDRLASFCTEGSMISRDAAQEQAARDAEEAQRIYQEDESYLHLMPVEGEEYEPSSTLTHKKGMPPKVLWMISEDEGADQANYDEPSELDFSCIEQQ